MTCVIIVVAFVVLLVLDYWLIKQAWKIKTTYPEVFEVPIIFATAGVITTGWWIVESVFKL